MAAQAPKQNNTLVIVLLLAFVAIIGLVGIGVAALVIRQPAIIGTVLAKVTGQEIAKAKDAPAVPEEPITAPSDTEQPAPALEEPVVETPPVEEPVVEPEPVVEEPVVEPEPEPEPPAAAPEKPAEKPAEKPVAKPAEKKPAEKKPAAESTAGLATGPRKFYIHIGKCMTPKEARELQADLNGRWSSFGIKQDSEKGLNFSFWKLGVREGRDPKSFDNEDYCYQIRTGAITQKQAKHLQGKLKAIGHTAGIGQEA